MLYGIRIDNHRPCDHNGAMAILQELKENGWDDLLENYEVNRLDNKKADPSRPYTFNDWIENYQDDAGDYGPAAFLRDAIHFLEGIYLDIKPYETYDCIGISPMLPWDYSRHIANLNAKQYRKILSNYTQRLYGRPLPIKYQPV